MLRRVSFAIAVTAAVFIGIPVAAVAQDQIELEFTVWNYSIETIQDNIRKFEEQNPGIKVKLTDYAWPDYHDTMVLRFRNNPPDIVYSGEDWLPEWASAGWLAPLLAKAIVGDATVQEVMDEGAEQWLQLRKQFMGQ